VKWCNLTVRKEEENIEENVWTWQKGFFAADNGYL